MDYEQKYKDALEKAKSKLHYPDKPCFVDVTEIFPELKESEDERIRKALLNEFILLQSKGYKFAGLEGEEIISWLEKQGENSAAEYNQWKPSEEQMKTLKETIIGTRGPLYELYFDLTKL